MAVIRKPKKTDKPVDFWGEFITVNPINVGEETETFHYSKLSSIRKHSPEYFPQQKRETVQLSIHGREGLFPVKETEAEILQAWCVCRDYALRYQKQILSELPG